jgi:cellulose synthase operon protein YhjQ
MSVVGIVSMKGGVGKTSTTANLASALVSILGPGRVSVIDLDPQNALHWHFGLTGLEQAGICEQSRAGTAMHDVARETSFDVRCIPYGAGAEEDRDAFETLLARDPSWLARMIESNDLDNNSVVLIDTPPGPSVYLRQVFACADLVLVVLLADAASYATIPAMEAFASEMMETARHVENIYILNQVDATEPLTRDIANLLRQRLGPKLAPIAVHRDEAVCEALAFQQPVLVYDPHGQASHDLAQLATWLVDTLNR